jgi:hypothetical protein
MTDKPLVALMLISIATVFGFLQILLNLLHFPEWIDATIQWKNLVISGKGENYFNNRILVPYLFEGASYLAPAGFTERHKTLVAFALVGPLSVSFQLISLFYYLKLWFNREKALIGSLFVAGSMMITLWFLTHEYYSQIEVGLFCLGLYFFHEKRRGPLYAIIILACLNRETGLFLPFTFFLISLDFKAEKFGIPSKDMKDAVVCGVLGILVLLSLRLVRGFETATYSIAELQEENLRFMWYGLMTVPLVQGPFWIFAFFGYRNAPQFLRKAFWFTPFYLATLFIYSNWYGPRLYLLLYPFIIPVGLVYLFGVSVKSSDYG